MVCDITGNHSKPGVTHSVTSLLYMVDNINISPPLAFTVLCYSKGKFVPVHTLKEYGGVEVGLQLLLTSRIAGALFDSRYFHFKFRY